MVDDLLKCPCGSVQFRRLFQATMLELGVIAEYGGEVYFNPETPPEIFEEGFTDQYICVKCARRGTRADQMVAELGDPEGTER